MSDALRNRLDDARRLRSTLSEEARALYAAVADDARRIGCDDLLAHALRHISDLDREQGRTADARKAADEAVAIYRRSAPGLDLANALRLAALARETSAARPLWSEAYALYQATGAERGVAECAEHLEQTQN